MSFLENANFDWMDMLTFYERPFRASFVPSKVWQDLDRYRNDSKGLANYFKKWRTRIEWIPEKSKAKFLQTHVAVGGEYDPEKRQCILIIHTDKYDKFPFTDNSWRRFKFKLIQVEMHELIHFMQFDRRNDEWSKYILPHKKVGHAMKDAERRYLSEFDEIQAYAHCVLLDYKMFRPNVPIDTLLARCKKSRDSKTLHYILKTFGYDFRNNYAIPKLMTQILKWDRKYQRTIRAYRRS